MWGSAAARSPATATTDPAEPATRPAANAAAEVGTGPPTAIAPADVAGAEHAREAEEAPTPELLAKWHADADRCKPLYPSHMMLWILRPADRLIMLVVVHCCARATMLM